MLSGRPPADRRHKTGARSSSNLGKQIFRGEMRAGLQGHRGGGDIHLGDEKDQALTYISHQKIPGICMTKVTEECVA